MNQPDERAGLPSASSGERFFACPGSVSLEAQAPEGAPSDEAQQGVEIHEAMESEDFTDLDERGRTIAQKLAGFEAEVNLRFVRETQQNPTVLREERMWFLDEKRKPACSAKPDVALIGKTHASLLDFKTGYLRVTPAYRNIQMRIQALALWSEYPRVSVITTGIAAYRFTGSLDIVTYDIPALETAKRELLFNLWRTKQPEAPRVPGAWCKHCRAKSFCPEAASYSLLPIVPFIGQSHKKSDLIQSVQSLSLPQLAFIRERKSIIENILDAVDARMKGFTPDELKSVGWEKKGSGNARTIPDIQTLWGYIHQTGLLDDTEFRACLKATIGKIEEALVAKIKARDGGTEKDALAKAKVIIEPAVNLVPKAPMLKPLKALPEGE